MRRIFITLLLVFVCIACGQVTTEMATEEPNKVVAQTSVAQKQTEDCVRFKFHWLEIHNVLYTPVVRNIEIFFDEKAFSEENLKTLFAYLSEKNPDPKHLTVVVYTNWAQLDFPSPGCPGIGISEQPDPPDKYDYHRAIYYRREGREYFRYSPALKVHEANFKTVVISGKEKSPDE